MKQLFLLMLRTIEHHIILNGFSSEKKSKVVATLPVAIPLLISIILAILSSVVLKQLPLGLLLCFVSTLVALTLLLIEHKHWQKAEKRQQLSEEVRVLSILKEQFVISLSSIGNILRLALLVTLIVTLPTLLIATIDFSITALILALSTFISCYTILVILLYITWYKTTPDTNLTTMQGYNSKVRPDLRILAVFAVISITITALFWSIFALPIAVVIVATIVSTLLATLLFNTYMERNQLYSITQRQIYFEKLFNRYIGEPTFKGVLFATLAFLKRKLLVILYTIGLFVLLLIIVKNNLLAMHWTILICAVELVVLTRVKTTADSSSKRGLTFAKTITTLSIVAIFIGSLPTLSSFFNVESTNKLLLDTVAFVDSTTKPLSTLVQTGNILVMLLTVPAFFALYYIAQILQSASSRIQKYLLKRLPVSDTNTAIFHDNLSLYPVLLHTLVLVAVLYLLHAQLAFITTLVNTLIGTLQVSEVFKINWLSETNITLFFNVVFYIAVVYSVYKLIARLYTSLFSSLILYNDMLIFIDSKLSHKKIIQLPLSKIESVTFGQTPLEKLVDIGSILISSNEAEFTVKGVTSIHQRNQQISMSLK